VTCQEFVELVTEYLEGAMSASEQVRFAAHLDQCDGCHEYLVQFRETIAVVGHLPPESIDAVAEEKLLAAFRNWKRGEVAPSAMARPRWRRPWARR
jgi:anti-sigma factor RsiW